MNPLVRGITHGTPILAVAFSSTLAGAVAPAAGVPAPSKRAYGTQQPQKSDPCERRWRSNRRASHEAAGLGRPAPVNGAPSSTGAPASAAKAQGRPNIVTIMVDDMRADELRGPWMRNTRKLIANRGATFTHSYAPYALCAPARASFFTGQYGHNHHVRANGGPSAFKAFDDDNTFATWLNSRRDRRDYNTAFLGKYINGYAHPRYVPPGWDEWYGSLGRTTQQFRGTKLSDDGKGVINLSGRYQTKAYGKKASHLVRSMARKRKPFFLDLSFSAPHNGKPREADDPRGLGSPVRLKKNRNLYENRIVRPAGVKGEPCNADKPRMVSKKSPIGRKMQRKITKVRQQRAQALKTVDGQVRRVMRALRRTGELRNTYVMFTSDNGYFLGEFRQRAKKQMSYEPALRTPTLVRGPGIGRGVNRAAPFTSIDFASTIADMANVRKHGSVDGVSLLPQAKGRSGGRNRAILTDVGPRLGKTWYGRGVRAPGFLYMRYHDKQTRRELYDLSRDPHQNHNVARNRRYRDTVRRLDRVLRELRNCEERECRRHW